jgi:hypothetical protein
MATKPNKTRDTTEMAAELKRFERGFVVFHLLGTAPLVMNRPSAKAKQQLLLPSRAKNQAEKQVILKHDPLAEFRDTMYRCREDNAPTLFHFPAGAFKKALGSAALRTPGATKTEIGCLVQVVDQTVHVYGKPYLYMDWVRLEGMKRVPDIRTRAMFRTWAVKLTVQFIKTLTTERAIVNLMSNAGDVTGIGDGRTEKGTFSNGGWEVVDARDPRWLEVVKNGGRKVQQAAYDNPEASDIDSEELWVWYESEIVRREASSQREGSKAKAKAKDEAKDEAKTPKAAKGKRPAKRNGGGDEAGLPQ